MSAFLYIWTHLPTKMWYVGSRVAKGCHINDGYICSSKIVKPLILANPSDWNREILEEGEGKYIRDLETDYLTITNAAQDHMSFNKHNGGKNFNGICRLGSKHSDETRAKISAAGKGKTFTDEHKAKMSAAHKGKKQSDETKLKMSSAKLGKTFTDEHKAKISAANKGIKFTDEHKIFVKKVFTF